jgi:hypothetical protein
MAPVVLFFDTEYSQRDSAHCAPISLALVARDTGDELYLVLEGGWTPQDCSDFVRANVLPQLHGLDPIVCTAAGALGAIETFIARLRSDPWQPVQLACDWPMDWDVLMQLPLAPKQWAAEHSIQPVLLHHLIDQPEAVQTFNRARDNYLANPPGENATGHHHALIDARALYHAWHTTFHTGD